VTLPGSSYPPASEFFPERLSLKGLREKVQGCRACPLYQRATQAVFGEGPAGARLVLIGEQPGDQEDRQGRPFVGPAGAVLDEMLSAVGLERSELYVTNAVKHFKWKATRGKRRLHEKPGLTEISACLPWFEAELEVVEPEMIVCLGATAAQALLGRAFRITRQHGEVFEENGWAPWVMATYHPSALLRADDEGRDALRRDLAADLERAAERYRRGAAGGEPARRAR
jgi:DNA polymerase